MGGFLFAVYALTLLVFYLAISLVAIVYPTHLIRAIYRISPATRRELYWRIVVRLPVYSWVFDGRPWQEVRDTLISNPAELPRVVTGVRAVGFAGLAVWFVVVVAVLALSIHAFLT
jgi:hypothetical protein